MKTYPNSPAMLRRIERHSNLNRLTLKIPAMLAFECQITLAAYHGGHVRAGLALIRYGFHSLAQSAWIGLLVWITDRVGWTKLVPIEPGSEYKKRHGGKCDKLNCNDFECLERGLPKWFRWLTRWDK